MRILDRRTFPESTSWVLCHDAEEVAAAIAAMVTQSSGPLFATYAALALTARQVAGLPLDAAHARLAEAAHVLATARPTNAHPAEATERVLAAVASAATTDELVRLAQQAADDGAAAYRASSRALARHTLDLLPQDARVLTHCWMDTYLTELVHEADERGHRLRWTATETRPYLQGARLTSHTLAELGHDVELVTDGAAAYAVATGRVDAVVTAADRVSLDGHVANKTGTLSLALAAREFGVPMHVLVIAPDPHSPTGADIVVEEREGTDVLHVQGHRTASPLVGRAWYPAFDLTPPHLVTSIVTERGAFEPAQVGELHAGAALLSGADDVAAVLREHGVTDAVDDVREVTASNMNRVFVARRGERSWAVKQAPPFVQVAGPSWPMSQDRARVEAEALRRFGDLAPGLVPHLDLYDADRHVLVMEDLSELEVLRDRWVGDLAAPDAPAEAWEHVGTAVGELVGRVASATSRPALGADAFAALQHSAGNTELRELTDQVLFDELFREHPHNRVPEHLAERVRAVYADDALREHVQALREGYASRAEALLHGDLHSGSIMVSRRGAVPAVRVFDPEFSIVGPVGFDLGLFWANSVIAARAADALGRPDEAATRLATVETSWAAFTTALDPAAGLDADAVLADAIGFAGIEAARRVIGYSHAADLETLPSSVRTTVQTQVLEEALAWIARRVQDVPSLVRGTTP